MKLTKKLTPKIGLILLSIWLILTGLLPYVSITIPYVKEGMSILVIAAGIFILLDK